MLHYRDHPELREPWVEWRDDKRAGKEENAERPWERTENRPALPGRKVRKRISMSLESFCYPNNRTGTGSMRPPTLSGPDGQGT